VLEHLNCEQKLRELGLFSLQKEWGGSNSGLPVPAGRLSIKQCQAHHYGAWMEDERQQAKFRQEVSSS